MATSAVGVSQGATLNPSASALPSGLGAVVQKLGGQYSDGSAVTAQRASSLADQVQQIAAQNTALSFSQAETLRKWQEQQNAKAMNFNAAEAAKNRDWQKMMSDTAHQREVRDLQAAGLNPILSAMGGNGASVGSGATASGVTSSGAQGDVDKAASSGLVSLLGTLMNTQTQLLSQAMSARSNEAIADKNNATSELIAHLTGDYGLQKAALTGEYGLQSAGISAKSQQSIESMKEAHDIFMAKNYPTSLLGVVEALISAFGGDKSTVNSVKMIGEKLGEKLGEAAAPLIPDSGKVPAKFAPKPTGNFLQDILNKAEFSYQNWLREARPRWK